MAVPLMAAAVVCFSIFMLYGAEMGVLTAATVILIIFLLIMMEGKDKKRRKKKQLWYKHLEPQSNLPKAWIAPSIWRRKSPEDEKSDAKKELSTDFGGLDKLEFERFIIALLRRIGYEANAAPKRGPKLGGFAVNIIAEKDHVRTAIETRSAGEGIVEERDVIRLLRSRKAFKADRMLIISAAAVSDAAYSAAKTKPLDIWDDSKLRRMVKVYLTR
jgi:HJR/Mrr/RecB family endonuclease